MAQRNIAFEEGSCPNLSSALKGAIQLGIAHSEERLCRKAERDILMQDFEQQESVFFPSGGGDLTPAHCYSSDFTFRTFAPVAFRYFRDVFGVRPDDYRASLCSDHMSLIEQASDSEEEEAGRGGSSPFYAISSDDKFVVKAVRCREVSVLLRLLPGYYMNLNQNKCTLLPRLYGLYCLQQAGGGKTVHIAVMNNLLPRDVTMHHRYYLKGSTYKRRAAARETERESPTYKDLDFILNMPSLLLDAAQYAAVSRTVQKDSQVLQNFNIINYRLTVGVHNLDRACREEHHRHRRGGEEEEEGAGAVGELRRRRPPRCQTGIMMDGIRGGGEAASLYGSEDHYVAGIPARNAKGERLLLYVGITDILQSYTLAKMLEHKWKSLVADGDSVSVHRPGFYAERFQRFMCNTVFTNLTTKVLPAALSSSSPPNRKVPKKKREESPTPTPTPTPFTPPPSAPPPSPPYPALAPPSCCLTLKDVQMHLHHLQLHLHHLLGGDENSLSFGSADHSCSET